MFVCLFFVYICFSFFSQRSCAQIHLIVPDAKSGYYWIHVKDKQIEVYCDMITYGMNSFGDIVRPRLQDSLFTYPLTHPFIHPPASQLASQPTSQLASRSSFLPSVRPCTGPVSWSISLLVRQSDSHPTIQPSCQSASQLCIGTIPHHRIPFRSRSIPLPSISILTQRNDSSFS